MRKKPYVVNLEFKSRSFVVRAKSAAEAKAKIMQRVRRGTVRSVVDHSQTYVEEG